MENFEFVTQVVLHSLILGSTNLVSTNLQKHDVVLFKAAELLKNAQNELIDLRNNYDTAIVTVTAIAQQWRVKTDFKNKRCRKTKKHVDELAEDERLSDPNLYFKTVIFFGTLDIVINQITFRFEGMANVASMFSVLTPGFLSSATDEQLHLKATELALEYSEDLTSDFPSEILSFRRTLKPEMKIKKSLKHVAELLFVDNYSIACSIPDVCTAYLFFLTLPVTVAQWSNLSPN